MSSSDALNKGEHDEHTGNDRDNDPEESKGQQEIGKGDKASKDDESRSSNQGEDPIWKQGRNRPGLDEAQGWRHARGNRKGPTGRHHGAQAITGGGFELLTT